MNTRLTAFWVAMFSAVITFLFSVLSVFGYSYLGVSGPNVFDAALIAALGWWGFRKENFWPAAALVFYCAADNAMKPSTNFFAFIYFGAYLLAAYNIWQEKGWGFTIVKK